MSTVPFPSRSNLEKTAANASARDIESSLQRLLRFERKWRHEQSVACQGAKTPIPFPAHATCTCMVVLLLSLRCHTALALFGLRELEKTRNGAGASMKRGSRALAPACSQAAHKPVFNLTSKLTPNYVSICDSSLSCLSLSSSTTPAISALKPEVRAPLPSS